MAWASDFKIRLLSPEAVCFEGEGVRSAVIPLGDGFMGILPNHGNFIGRLGMGQPMSVWQMKRRFLFSVVAGFTSGIMWWNWPQKKS